MVKIFIITNFCLSAIMLGAQNPVPVKPRVLISTDIGGTDPDDNQSMAHLLMYSDRFAIEGLVSSPSYGNGSKEEILRMIALYEKDFPKLFKQNQNLAKPRHLRAVTKQGRRGNAPFNGYTTSTEGSDWIIKCARKRSSQPLWFLGWGGLEDLAQALHDAPDIQNRIRVYWIGGPNKKWSANSYAYIVQNFPNLWFIEVNSSYYGFFANNKERDSITGSNYFEKTIRGAGNLGRDFKNYYNGEVKMGDSPSLFYLMDGDPENPLRESWGGSFQRLERSPRIVVDRVGYLKDTVAFCSILEFHLKGPKTSTPPGSICFWMEVPYGKSIQKWPGYYLGNGDYAIRYIPKKAEIVPYHFSSDIPEIDGQEGSIVVENFWPGKTNSSDYPLGRNWFTDKPDQDLYDGNIQGGKTVQKWRNAILQDWAIRWGWLKNDL